MTSQPRLLLLLFALPFAACGPVVEHRSDMIHGEGACHEHFGDPYFRFCMRQDETLLAVVDMVSDYQHRADPRLYELEIENEGETLLQTNLEAEAPVTRGSCIGLPEGVGCQDRSFRGTGRVTLTSQTLWPLGRYRIQLTNSKTGKRTTFGFTVQD